MLRLATTRPVKFLVLGLSVAATSATIACPPSGGHRGGGYQSRPVVHHAPRYHAPPVVHHAPPVYSTPSYPVPQQPVYQGQPGFPSQPIGPGGVAQGTPTQLQFPASQGQPAQNQVNPQQQQQFASQPPSAPQAQQPQQASPAAADGATMTALQMLAGMPAPQAPSQPVGQPQASAPVEKAAQPPIAPATQPQLAPATDPRVGSWIATLANQTTVRLELRADGSFLWTASANGKTSSFQGSFAVAGASLTLTRSNDNQRLAGTLTDNANGFNFKLDGASDGGLDFVRG